MTARTGGARGPLRRRAGTVRARISVLDDGAARGRDDWLAAEEPLEIRVAAGREVRTVGVTMRTPGADFELAAGYLHTEGVVGGKPGVRRIEYCVASQAANPHNVVTVHLPLPSLPPLDALERYGTISSACGVCGKASLEALELRGMKPLIAGTPRVTTDVLYRLPDALRAGQSTFDATGGLHAAGLFTAAGALLAVREDVGRHNAVDKVVGWALLKGHLDEAADGILVVSGRAGYEIVQKAAAARIPVVCAVSAPSSLAVAAAERFGLTLVGFLRGRRANVYSGAGRIT